MILCTRTIVLRECEYGIERNGVSFSNRAGRPLIVDELIVACDCDHGVGHTLAAISRAKIQPGQNLLRESDVVRIASGTARLCDIQNHHCHGSHCPTKGRSISPILFNRGVPGCMLKSA